EPARSPPISRSRRPPWLSIWAMCLKRPEPIGRLILLPSFSPRLRRSPPLMRAKQESGNEQGYPSRYRHGHRDTDSSNCVTLAAEPGRSAELARPGYKGYPLLIDQRWRPRTRTIDSQPIGRANERKMGNVPRDGSIGARENFDNRLCSGAITTDGPCRNRRTRSRRLARDGRFSKRRAQRAHGTGHELLGNRNLR